MTIDPQCYDCKHLVKPTRGERMRCDAFPGEIPVAILLNKHDHRVPYPGDRGIGFEAIAAPAPTPSRAR